MKLPLPPRSIRPGPRAFTLIEVLIATAIFGTVLVAMNTVFYGALRLRKTTAKIVEDSIPINHALAVMRADLRSMLAPGDVLAGPISGGRQSAMQGQRQRSLKDDLVFLDICTTTGVTDDSLVLNDPASSALNNPLPWPEAQRVAYYLRDPVDTASPIGRDLVRVVSRNLLAAVEEFPEEVPLLGGVETLEFLFYDGAMWRDSWNSTNEITPVPLAIKVQIELAPENRDERLRKPLIELVVPVVTQTRTNQVSETGANSQQQATSPNSNSNPAGGGGPQGGTQPQTQPQRGGSPGGGNPGAGGQRAGGGR